MTIETQEQGVKYVDANNKDVFTDNFEHISHLVLVFLLLTLTCNCRLEGYYSSGAEAHSESFQTSKMECFAKIANGFQPLNLIAKNSILYVLQGSKYASVMYRF